MSKLWDFIFKRDKQFASVDSTPLIHETFSIDLTDPDYITWLQGARLTHIRGLLSDSIKSYQSNGYANSPYIEIIKQNTYSGIAIKKEIPGYSISDYKYLLYNLVELLQTERYIKKLSEVRSVRKRNHLDMHYNTYLKPSIKIQQSFPINQLFGNIRIELLLRDDIFNTFRIKSMVYQDRNYQPAASFLEYMLSALSK